MRRGHIKKNLLGNKMSVVVANTIIVVAEADAKTEKKNSWRREDRQVERQT